MLISLHNRKGSVVAHAIVDDEAFERASVLRWSMHPTGYVTAAVRVNDKVHTFYLHRFVLGYTGSMKIDHRNRNKLDCRKENLRIATPTQNNANCLKRSNNTSGYKGVCRHPKNDTWQIKIGHQGKTIYIGCHPDVIEAAKLYDQAARDLYGEFAVTNF